MILSSPLELDIKINENPAVSFLNIADFCLLYHHTLLVEEISLIVHFTLN